MRKHISGSVLRGKHVKKQCCDNVYGFYALPYVEHRENDDTPIKAQDSTEVQKPRGLPPHNLLWKAALFFRLKMFAIIQLVAKHHFPLHSPIPYSAFIGI